MRRPFLFVKSSASRLPALVDGALRAVDDYEKIGSGQIDLNISRMKDEIQEAYGDHPETLDPLMKSLAPAAWKNGQPISFAAGESLLPVNDSRCSDGFHFTVASTNGKLFLLHGSPQETVLPMRAESKEAIDLADYKDVKQRYAYAANGQRLSFGPSHPVLDPDLRQGIYSPSFNSVAEFVEFIRATDWLNRPLRLEFELERK